MPSGHRIDWSLYDHILATQLPLMTIEDWQQQHAPYISTKAIGARARKWGIKPAKYRPSPEHKAKIAKALTIEDESLVAQIKAARDSHSNKQLCDVFRLDDTTLWRILSRNKIRLSKVGTRRARDASRKASLGRIPWNKDGELSDETKAKISIATSGQNNSQYGRGMTEEEKEKWRIAYFSHGIYKMREWLQSPAGISSLIKMMITTKSDEFRSSSSQRMTLLIQQGVIKTNRGHGTHVATEKGGSFYTKSTYETRYARQLDADTKVVRFFYEPLRIPYEFEGTQLYYVPDFLVEYQDRHEELVEVKPAKLVNLPKNIAKIEAGRLFHTHFMVVTEEGLRFNAG